MRHENAKGASTVTDTHPTGLGRRSLLLGGGTAVAAALGGGLLLPGGAHAQTITGGRFNLATGAEKFIREKTLHHTTVLQSFAFDNVNKHIYVLQVIGATENGDMILTKVNYSGTKLGHMRLNRFGHGVGMGVEMVGSTPWIWTETDRNPDSGYGRAVTRFKFTNGQTLTYGSSLTTYRAHSGSTSNTPSIDQLNNRIAIRYRHSGAVHYKVFKLSDFKNRNFTPVHTFKQVGIGSSEVFQGWCLHGNYVYQMTGTAYTGESGGNPPSKKGNCYLSSIDVRTGQLYERKKTQAAYSLDFREPEGLAVQLSSPRRLHMGFASGKVGARKLTLYYKPQ
jgi:hypothetical protein